MTPERLREIWKKASQQYRDNDPKRANAVAKKYRDSHPKSDEKKEESRQTSVKWRKDFKERDPIAYKDWRTDKTLRYRYGITRKEYLEKLESQKGLCALCRKPFDNSGKDGKPHLDHNHVTGKNRDFVHGRCNTALGMLRDDPEQCLLAADYLERHKSGRVYENGILQRSDCAGATRAHSYAGI